MIYCRHRTKERAPCVALSSAMSAADEFSLLTIKERTMYDDDIKWNASAGDDEPTITAPIGGGEVAPGAPIENPNSQEQT
jgi:hypothetical protein